jgi:putative ABC transport system ATP-binding protein
MPSTAGPNGSELSDGVVIRTDGLTKIYTTGTSEVRALNGIDFSVEQGEMIAIIGASGSGKSTLMNIIGCLDYPTSGTYHLDGIRVDGLNKNQLADIRNQKIGFVFQGFNLLARTQAIDNVELPLLYDRSGRKLDTRQMATEALQRVGLVDRLDHEPSELSGGEQQRVAIARALVTQPAILLADEPTGNLDSRTSVDVLALFQELNDAGAVRQTIGRDARWSSDSRPARERATQRRAGPEGPRRAAGQTRSGRGEWQGAGGGRLI